VYWPSSRSDDEKGDVMMKKTEPKQEIPTRGTAEREARQKTGRVARRAVISGAAAAGVGATALLVAGSRPASAAVGDPVLIDELNSTEGYTAIEATEGNGLFVSTTANHQAGLESQESSTSGGWAITGISTNGTGVNGSSANATGITGEASASGYAGIYGTSAGGDGIWGNTTADGFSGTIGVDNSSGGGNGLAGYSTHGTGVYGTSTDATGIYGEAKEAGFAGIYGTSAGGDGIWGNTTADGFSGTVGVDNSTGGGSGVSGYSTHGTGVSGTSAKATGVSGEASAPGFAGVYANSGGGDGVWGNTSAAGFSGVVGVDNSTGTSSTGVAGFSAKGTGVLATSADGTALRVNGSAVFSTCGVATVASGGKAGSKGSASAVTVTGVELSASSLVLATAQGAIAGVAIEGVVVDVAAKSFTIHLTKALTTSLKIAWFVIETAPQASEKADRELARAPKLMSSAATRQRPAAQRPALAGRRRPVLRTATASRARGASSGTSSQTSSQRTL
jgi:hypothetical protein